MMRIYFLSTQVLCSALALLLPASAAGVSQKCVSPAGNRL